MSISSGVIVYYQADSSSLPFFSVLCRGELSKFGTVAFDGISGFGEGYNSGSYSLNMLHSVTTFSLEVGIVLLGNQD